MKGDKREELIKSYDLIIKKVVGRNNQLELYFESQDFNKVVFNSMPAPPVIAGETVRVYLFKGEIKTFNPLEGFIDLSDAKKDLVDFYVIANSGINKIKCVYFEERAYELLENALRIDKLAITEEGYESVAIYIDEELVRHKYLSKIEDFI
ncbi:MAG: hypothetical protein WC307_02610 [Candidatus Nanoarchaeia archaeon]|jgi:hypothetical protein